MKYFLCVIGMVMIIEGLPYFAFPEKMKRWIIKIFEMDDSALRWMGLFFMAIGFLLVFIGRQ
ncbi:MAG: DUF2065 domain-containing protein [Desulfobacterium sp.]|nr:DUF2065 domain-containing protein [Desulfobacterium sp.]MBU3949147.1 DUF2065 domain-containing protein [Pseudomonadota bacterium]MBU4011800.1 DUF2065 domain-containing protein [Pseudomonadota bacterium]MBU4036523.1 DUF2065 domain-containing protein [Pseudomonadota bacterium]